MLEGKKVLYIVAQENFRDEELTEPRQLLESKGAKITVASISTDEARGMLGLRIKPGIAIRAADPDDYDCLVVAGGSGSPKLADYPEVLDMLRRFHEQNKLIAAICVAPYVLARAGLLKGVSVTAYPADFVLAELRRAGAVYIERPVVTDEDNKIITADGPKSARQFAEAVIDALKI